MRYRGPWIPPGQSSARSVHRSTVHVRPTRDGLHSWIELVVQAIVAGVVSSETNTMRKEGGNGNARANAQCYNPLTRHAVHTNPIPLATRRFFRPTEMDGALVYRLTVPRTAAWTPRRKRRDDSLLQANPVLREPRSSTVICRP